MQLSHGKNYSRTPGSSDTHTASSQIETGSRFSLLGLLSQFYNRLRIPGRTPSQKEPHRTMRACCYPTTCRELHTPEQPLHTQPRDHHEHFPIWFDFKYGIIFPYLKSVASQGMIHAQSRLTCVCTSNDAQESAVIALGAKQWKSQNR